VSGIESQGIRIDELGPEVHEHRPFDGSINGFLLLLIEEATWQAKQGSP